MKKLLLILILFVFYAQMYGQNTDKAKTSIGAAYNADQVLYHVFEKTLELLRVNIVSGTVTVTGGATSTNQSTQITRADSLALLIKLLYYRLNALTNGSQLTKPYLYYINVRDSVVGADTATYNFSNNYAKTRVSVYNSNVSTPDTLIFEHYSTAKLGWTTNAVGFRNILTDSLIVDNTSIIIPTSTVKTYEINMSRAGQVRIRPKTLTARTSAKKEYISFIGVNE